MFFHIIDNSLSVVVMPASRNAGKSAINIVQLFLVEKFECSLDRFSKSIPRAIQFHAKRFLAANQWHFNKIIFVKIINQLFPRRIKIALRRKTVHAFFGIPAHSLEDAVLDFIIHAFLFVADNFRLQPFHKILIVHGLMKCDKSDSSIIAIFLVCLHDRFMVAVVNGIISKNSQCNGSRAVRFSRSRRTLQDDVLFKAEQFDFIFVRIFILWHDDFAVYILSKDFIYCIISYNRKQCSKPTTFVHSWSFAMK